MIIDWYVNMIYSLEICAYSCINRFDPTYSVLACAHGCSQSCSRTAVPAHRVSSRSIPEPFLNQLGRIIHLYNPRNKWIN